MKSPGLSATLTLIMKNKGEKKETPAKRPPVVAVLGHVDHGKTSLLDSIRKTDTATREAGGITQAIGAYEIEHDGRKITFIDTPGHEAFSKMRSHGAKAADLAVLVVAADDGVKPQTEEAIEHISVAKTPFVVAVNKIDKPNANIEKTKQDLSKVGVYLEGYGGSVSWQAISAKTGEGINELLDLFLLAADMENLETGSGNSGFVISSRLESRRGNLVGIIIQSGEIRPGQFIATPSALGKIKVIENEKGERIKAALPSSPVLVLGFETLPSMGEQFFTSDSERELKELVEKKKEEESVLMELIARGKASADDSFKVIIKADELASLEALADLIEKIKNEIPIAVMDGSVGIVTENDVKLAIHSGAAIVGFRTKADKASRNLASARGVEIIESDIIYRLEEDIREKMVYRKETGALEVLAIFGKPEGKKKVIGGKVSAGIVRNNAEFEIKNKENVIGKGRILNLQSGKEDVLEVEEGNEAGLLVESEISIKPGFQLIFY